MTTKSIIEGILIPMRLGSTRLPGKGLLQVGPVTALELLARRLSRAERPGLIVLCTTEDPSDDALSENAQRLGLRVYRGATDDVLLRLTKAAEANNLERVAEVDGDDLLCDPRYVDRTLERLVRTGADHFTYVGLPFGIACHALTTKAIRRACDEKLVSDTSTGVFNYILKSGNFSLAQATAPPEHQHPTARFTLDYPEDLEFFRAVLRCFPGRECEFTLEELLDLLKRRPDIVGINCHLTEEYWRNFRAKESSAAKRV